MKFSTFLYGLLPGPALGCLFLHKVSVLGTLSGLHITSCTQRKECLRRPDRYPLATPYPILGQFLGQTFMEAEKSITTSLHGRGPPCPPWRLPESQ